MSAGPAVLAGRGRSGGPSPLASAGGLVEREWLLLRRGVPGLLSRSLVQPLLFVFVFTYVYPKIGAAISIGAGGASMPTVILPGIIGFSMLFCGLYTIGMPLAMDLGMERSLDDRSLAPVPFAALPLVRLVSGTVQAAVAGLVVPVMIGVVAVTSPDTHGMSWALAVPATLLGAAVTAGIGLTIAGAVRAERLPAVMTVIHLPLTFLGAGYYPWRSLHRLPVLEWALLANPMTYVSELLRAVFTPRVPHMSPLVTVPVLAGLLVLMAWLGSVGVIRQVKEAR